MMGMKLRDQTWQAIASAAIPDYLQVTCLRIAEIAKDDPGQFYASSATLATDLGSTISERAMRKRLAAIAEIGFMTLDAVHTQNYPNVWRIHPLQTIGSGDVLELNVERPSAMDTIRAAKSRRADKGTRQKTTDLEAARRQVFDAGFGDTHGAAMEKRRWNDEARERGAGGDLA